jgi:hypothetical protein
METNKPRKKEIVSFCVLFYHHFIVIKKADKYIQEERFE